MNRDRQVRSRQPVQHLNRRQAAQATRSTHTREDDGSDVSTQAEEEDEYDDVWPPRLSSSARPYVDLTRLRGPRYVVHSDQVQRIPPRRSAQVQGAGERRSEDVPIAKPTSQKRPFSAHPLLYLGIGMLLMLALWVVGQDVFFWWKLHQDDMQYGRPRTFQIDAVVGHTDSPANPTHLILLNLNRHVQIIELPGGDASHARIYTGPVLFGDGQDLTPVTGEVRDVNADGKPDLIVHIQDQHVVFINDGTQFRPLKPGEHVTL